MGIARREIARPRPSFGWKGSQSTVKILRQPSHPQDAAVCGSPVMVRAELATQIESNDFNYLVFQVAWGTLGHAQEMHSLALFRTEVMPNLAGARATASGRPGAPRDR